MKIRKKTCIAQTGILKLRISKRHQPLIERPPVDSWSSEEAEPLLIIEPPVNYETTEAKYSCRTALDIIGKRHTLAGNSHRASQPASTLAAIMGVRPSVHRSAGRMAGRWFRYRLSLERRQWWLHVGRRVIVYKPANPGHLPNYGRSARF